MRFVFLAMAALLIGLALTVGGWGIWLLTTPDYQGGRDLAGSLSLLLGVALGFLGIGLAVLTRPNRS
jgi:hypothetical protein